MISVGISSVAVSCRNSTKFTTVWYYRMIYKEEVVEAIDRFYRQLMWGLTTMYMKHIQAYMYIHFHAKDILVLVYVLGW